MKSEKPDSFWTVKDVANYLNVDEKTIYNWIRKGILPHMRLSGGSIRFNPNEIMQWAISKKRNNSSELNNKSFGKETSTESHAEQNPSKQSRDGGSQDGQ